MLCGSRATGRIMKLAGIAFTGKGKALLERISSLLQEDTLDCYQIGGTEERLAVPDIDRFAQKGFAEYDGLLFVGACGIAVRAIAPYVESKLTDPAVVVLDERGEYAVPVLSGHLGGANRLAKTLADLIAAQAVITTATDINGMFAVDVWAKEQGLSIITPKAIQAVSSAVLSGREIGFDSDFPYTGNLPAQLTEKKAGALGLCVSAKIRHPFAVTLLCVPRTVTIGIGCRKGIAEELLEQAICQRLEQENIPLAAVEQVCSIDRKKEEPAILAFCRKYRLPFCCYTADELSSVPGEFRPSAFVQKTVGVDNVCERAAILGSGGRLILSKTVENGVTIAAATRNFQLTF